MYCLLNLLAFLWHGILMLLDEDYQRARASAHRLDEFFNYLRAALRMAVMSFTRENASQNTSRTPKY